MTSPNSPAGVPERYHNIGIRIEALMRESSQNRYAKNSCHN
ncbi:MAG: hypothetical protein QM533_02350 [Cytophagales bacterium]|nr:hypothetical protein [Cytophagales bacterium]